MNPATRCTCGEPVLPGKPHNHPPQPEGEIKPFESPDAEMKKGLEIQSSIERLCGTASDKLELYGEDSYIQVKASGVIKLVDIIDRQAEQIEAKDNAIAAIWEILSDDFPKGTGDDHGTCASPVYLKAIRLIEAEFKRIDHGILS